MRLIVILLIGLAFSSMAWTAEPKEGAYNPYFVVKVVDDQTGRGVPLVELRSPSNVAYWTDSNGVAAINEPGWAGREVFFTVFSHGYEFPADGFGFHGKALKVTPGGEAKLSIHRRNIAERLYRVTGDGIYRDSVLAGLPVPTTQPTLNGEVTGQDSVQTAVYNGKIHWFYGDTNRLRYPLGHFGMAGAVSDLPAKGGLDPAVGVNLHYFTGPDGFSRPMTEPAPGLLQWLDGFTVLPDENGCERLLAVNQKLKSLTQPIDRKLVQYDDEADLFRPVRLIEKTEPLYPRGHPFRVSRDGVDYVYFNDPLPCIRVKADLASFKDPAAYEAYTCLPAGGRFDGEKTPLERDENGHLKWGWKRDADVLTLEREEKLVKAGEIKEAEARDRLKDVDSDHVVKLHAGSIYYNDYRKKWIAIISEVGGQTSMLGETWYSEAEQPEGPWRYAKHIVTHDRYSFYNPKQHPFFDQERGRIIYFEGTYTYTFSRQGEPTPRYDYNQIMYRLDLADPRLKLPSN